MYIYIINTYKKFNECNLMKKYITKMNRYVCYILLFCNHVVINIIIQLILKKIDTTVLQLLILFFFYNIYSIVLYYKMFIIYIFP